jgi:hypothetical protein
LREYSAFWISSDSGLPPSTEIPTSKEYLISSGAEIFLDDFFGESYLWYTPKTDWKWDGENDRINFYDFNAIETNIESTRALLEGIQYTIPAITVVKDRTQTYIDYLDSINRLEGNLEALRTNFVTPTGYPGTKAWSQGIAFDYNDMNRLERDIQLLFEILFKVYASFVQCGTIRAGYARGDLNVI